MKLVLLLFAARFCHCSWAPFPNYFGELEEQDHGLVEEAISRVVNRIDFPYAENDQIKQEHFFVRVKQRANELDPNAKVYLGGDAISSVLGYVYEKVYNLRTLVENRNMNTKEALTEIISNQRSVLSIEALGVGNRMDVYFDFSTDANAKELGTSLENFINSASKFLEISKEKATKLQLSLIPTASVGPVKEKIQQAVYQGGSTIDLLIFDINNGKLIAPKNTNLGLFFKGKLIICQIDQRKNSKKIVSYILQSIQANKHLERWSYYWNCHS